MAGEVGKGIRSPQSGEIAAVACGFARNDRKGFGGDDPGAELGGARRAGLTSGGGADIVG